MPAFMAVSGWLSFRMTGCSTPPQTIREESLKGLIKTIERRALQLLIPYFVWSFIQFISVGNYTIEYLSKMVLYPDTYLWFLWVLFWICFLFKLAQYIAAKSKVDEMIFIGAFCAILLLLMVCVEIRMFGFQFLAYYFLFYTLGYCLHRFEATKCVKSLSNSIFLWILVLLWAFLAWGWTMHGLPSWMPIIPHVPASMLQYAYRGLTAMMAIVSLIGFAPKALNRRNKLNSFISSVGVASLGMYTAHLLVLGYLKKLILSLCPNMNTELMIVLLSVLTFIVAYLLVKLLSKSQFTARYFLGKLN
jgi:fucose 4-O-acetylase-like acetyltransferase